MPETESNEGGVSADRTEMIADRPVHYRTHRLGDGTNLAVAEHIRRHDSDEGWQLLYGEWTDFLDADSPEGSAVAALAKADAEMRFRLNTLGK